MVLKCKRVPTSSVEVCDDQQFCKKLHITGSLTVAIDGACGGTMSAAPSWCLAAATV